MQAAVNNDVKNLAQRALALTDYRSWLRRRRLRNRSFTVVSNDCWGAEVYKDMQLPFTTPFIGAMVGGPCYLKLASDFERIVRSPLEFTDKSRYPRFNELRANDAYPIGVLADDVEIDFMHFRSIDEARDKWNRRVKRINFDQIFFKLSYKPDDYFTDEHLRAFDALASRNRVIFSKGEHSGLETAVMMPDFVADGKKMYPISMRHFDVVAWLNGDLPRYSATYNVASNVGL